MIYRLTGMAIKRRIRNSVMLLCTLSAFLPAIVPLVQAEENLYTVTVPFAAQEPNSQDTAYKTALEQVLIRVTGSDLEEHLAQLAAIFPNPNHYVLRFRARPDNALEVSFDGGAIEQILRQNRQAVWGADRPLTLVWLAVDWGLGEREIVGSGASAASADAARSIDRNHLLRERIEDTAKHRGIPVVFPLLDTEDLENISFSDIWGGFDDRLIAASRRYGVSSILVGRVRVDDLQPHRWSYYFEEKRFSWFGSPEEATHQVANELAAYFAIPGGAVLETYSLTVAGIDSVVAYGRVQQLMASLSIVESFVLKKVSGQKVEYTVSVYGGIDRLNSALMASAVLQAVIVSDVGSFAYAGDNGGVMFTDSTRLDFNYLP